MTETDSSSAALPSFPPGMPGWGDLVTTDLDSARAFYAGLFGWTYQASRPEFHGYTLAEVDGRSAAGLIASAGGPVGWAVYFMSGDVYADAARVAELGGVVLQAPFQVGPDGEVQGHMGLFADPAGAVFSLWQPGLNPGAGHREGVGSVVWHSLNTPDPEQVLPFYAALLGAQAQPMGPDYATLSTLAQGQPIAGVYRVGAGSPAWLQGRPSAWTTFFRVSDAGAAVREAAARGGTLLEAPVPSPFGRIATLADPQGAVFLVADQVGEVGGA